MQRAVKRISGRPLDPVQVDIIFHLFGTEAGSDSLDPDRFAQVPLLCSAVLRGQQRQRSHSPTPCSTA